MWQSGLNGGVPWLSNTDGALCFICKSETEDFNILHLIAQTSERNSNIKKNKSSIRILWMDPPLPVL